MKFYLLSAIFASASAANIGFQGWMKQHSVEYSDKVEFLKRQAIFEANVVAVRKLNEEGHATFEVNHFADLTAEEFQEKFLLTSSSAPVRTGATRYSPSISDDDVPSAFDWRDEGAVTAVKDQGALGTCWIFSTVGNLEGQRFLKGDGVLGDLSVEHVLECDATTDDTYGDCGMFGGWPYLAMEGIIDRGGIFADEDMPYCAGISYGKDGNCMPCMADGYSEEMCGNHSDDDGGLPLYCEPETTLGQGAKGLCSGESDSYKFAMSISDWVDASSEKSDDIKKSLVELGPLSVALDATKLQFYKSGVFNPSKCSTTALNHAVLLVGYGTGDDGDYLIVKNSWADKWGMDGYFEIAVADDAGTCGINTAVVSGLV